MGQATCCHGSVGNTALRANLMWDYCILSLLRFNNLSYIWRQPILALKFNTNTQIWVFFITWNNEDEHHTCNIFIWRILLVLSCTSTIKDYTFNPFILPHQNLHFIYVMCTTASNASIISRSYLQLCNNMELFDKKLIDMILYRVTFPLWLELWPSIIW